MPKSRRQRSVDHLNPGLTGYQSNVDGGNQGVQAVYVDSANQRLFVAGAFTKPVKSLAAYSW